MTSRSAPIRVKPLLLAGGRSPGRQFPKHLVRMPDGRPLYQHQLDLLYRACPDANTIYISLSRDSVLDGFLQDVAKPFFSGPFGGVGEAGAAPISIVYDPLLPAGSELAGGPAAGLLAAHHADPDAAWLVVSCDYPLLTPDALDFLRRSYSADKQKPVTCLLRDSDGSCEPLVGVWGPEALKELAASSKRADSSESIGSVVQRMNGVTLSPPGDLLGKLMDMKNETDWEEAHRVLHNGFSQKQGQALVC